MECAHGARISMGGPIINKRAINSIVRQYLRCALITTVVPIVRSRIEHVEIIQRSQTIDKKKNTRRGVPGLDSMQLQHCSDNHA